MKKSELPLVGMRVKLIVRKRYFQGMGFSSLKPIVRKKRAFEGEGDFVARRGVEND